MVFSKMLSSIFKIVLLLLVICIWIKESDSKIIAKKGTKWNHRRGFIIKCCGSKSCIDVQSKSRTTTHRFNLRKKTKNPVKNQTSQNAATQVSTKIKNIEAEEPSEKALAADIKTEKIGLDPVTTTLTVAEKSTNENSVTSVSAQNVEEVAIADTKILTTIAIELTSTDMPPASDAILANQKTQASTVATLLSDTTPTASTLTAAPSPSSLSSYPLSSTITIAAVATPVTSISTASTTYASITSTSSSNSTLTSTSNSNMTATSNSNLTSTLTLTFPSISISSSSSSSTASTTTGSPTTTVPTYCPSVCQKNASLFDEQGNLKEPNGFGAWKTSSDTLFLFGNKLTTWRENLQECCKLGMTPLSIADSTKQTFLHSLANATWKLNYNYWTWGLKFPGKTIFNWCEANTPEVSKTVVTWQKGQPDNLGGNQSCLHLKVLTNVSQMIVTDRNCNEKFINACETKLTTPAPTCNSPSCLKITCARDDSLFFDKVQYADPKPPLIDPASHGTWQSSNGRVYMFSLTKETYEGAYTKCCNLGLKFLSIEKLFEYDSLIKALNDNVKIPPAIYWTSGKDSGCSGKHVWCSTSQIFREVKWSSSSFQIDATKNCVAASLSKTSAELLKEGCDVKMNFICEVRDTSNSTNNGKAIMNECALRYQINSSIVDALNLNTTLTQVNTNIKCYMKCVAEEGGFINYNGVAVDSNTIAMLELAAGDDDKKLADSMDAADKCGSLKGADDCDTATMIYECGKEKVPDVINDVVNKAEMSPGEDAPLPRNVAKCYAEYTCATDPVMRNMFINNLPNTATPSGKFYTICGQRYAISDASSTMNFASAASYCCSFGLRLVSLETLAEVTCIQNNVPFSTSAERFWTSGSMWAVNKYFWCPLGIRFFTGASHYAAEGSAAKNSFLLSLNLFNTSGVLSYKFTDEGPNRAARALCEEY